MTDLDSSSDEMQALAPARVQNPAQNPVRVKSAYPGRASRALEGAGEHPRGGKASGTAGAAATEKRTGAAAQKKPLTAAQKRAHDALVHRWVRYGVQLVFFIMAPALFSGAFNGAKYLATQVGLGAAIEPTSFVVQFAAVLAFTILFGRFFCGYACAFGTLGDYLYNAFEFVRKRVGIPRPQIPEPLVKILSFAKYAVLAAICIACFEGSWATFSATARGWRSRLYYRDPLRASEPLRSCCCCS